MRSNPALNPESLFNSINLKTMKQQVLRYFQAHTDRPTSRNSTKKQKGPAMPPT